MKQKIKRFILKYFDYDITGEYLDHNGTGYYKKKYKKKWRLKKRFGWLIHNIAKERINDVINLPRIITDKW